MKLAVKSSILGLIVGGLSACGGSGETAGTTTPQESAAVTVPTPAPATPTPAPTPAPTPVSTEERLVLPDNTLYSPGDYSAYANPWCRTYDPSLVVGRDLVDTISLVRSTFPNDVIITSIAPDQYSTISRCAVYGYHFLAFGNYLSTSPTATMQPKQIKDIRTLALTFDMTLAGDGEYNILTEFFLTHAPKDFGTKLEVGFFNHSAPDAIRFAKTGNAIGIYADNAGRNWTVTQADAFVMFIHDGGKDLLSGTLDIRGALAFLMARGVVSGDQWFNGIATGLEPRRGRGEATIRTWAVSYG